MAGRGINMDTQKSDDPKGLYTRLDAHASGRRSGDQFCIYVADRLVLPELTPADIGSISEGRHRMDALVRTYIHKHLAYRFVMVRDGASAYAIERTIQKGQAAGQTISHAHIHL